MIKKTKVGHQNSRIIIKIDSFSFDQNKLIFIRNF